MAYVGNAPARSFISFERQVFTIVNSQTAYALSHSVANENDIRLVVNNVVQEPGSGKAYTATGTALTLSAALTNGTDEMYCVFLGRATATSAPGAGSIGTAQLASDSVTLAKMASGTDGNIISYDASGNPVAVATGNDGQVLTSAGAGAPPVFETLPVGGITMADQWRYTGGVAFGSTAVVVNADWERSNTNAQGGLGTGMSQSSGIFTFPSTGIYSVSFHFNAYRSGESRYVFSEIQSTQNNSTYVTITQSYTHIKQADSSSTYCSANTNTLLDVTDTSNVKVRFRMRSVNEATLQGGTDENRTFATFIRLGDT